MLAVLLIVLSLGALPTRAVVSVEATDIANYGEYGKILRAEVDGVIYTIDAHHRLARAGRTLVRLPMDGMPYIEGAHLLPGPVERLFVGYEVADTDCSGAKIVALDLKTRRVLWAHPVAGTNVGPMLYEDGRLFVSAGGILLALDGATGHALWAHDGEWAGRDVDAFEAPRDAGEHLIYREWTAYQKPPREFRIHKLTGEVSVVAPAP